jgi:hypothetical protein
MIDQRLHPFFDVTRYFLEVSNINECLIEFQKTQRYLSDLIKLKAELEMELGELERGFKIFFCSKRDEIFRGFKKYDISPTEKNIEDATIKLFGSDYIPMREKVDNKRVNMEACQSLIMAMFQRKDIITETINFFRSKNENDNCLIKNKEFLRKLGIKLA